MKKVVCFGEMMMRLNPKSNFRFAQADSFEVSYSGSEANVAVSLANYGYPVSYVTKFPNNELGKKALSELRRFGVQTNDIKFGGERLGLYFLEQGASQRSSKIIYDRAFSSFSQSSSNDYDWERIFDDACWFHFSGITPALSDEMPLIIETACKIAKTKGLFISCDLNYRKKLWSTEKANLVMSKLFNYVDLCIANEEDVQNVFGFSVDKSEIEQARLEQSDYQNLAKKIIDKFGCKNVAFTLRKSFSADVNEWSAMLISSKECITSKSYKINLVDRVGAGDSFSGALIYGLCSDDNLKDALEFAVAASCLKQTIHNDFNLASLEEVKQLAAGSISGRIIR